MTMITEIEDFFTRGCGRCARFDTPECSALVWSDGLRRLREICLDAGLDETLKWGHPCYMGGGRNIAIMGAFRGGIRLTFFKAALMTDPEGVLQKQGPNTQHADMIGFDGLEDVIRLEPVVRAYLAEAVGYAEAGIVPEKVVREMDWPEELIEALDADPELAEAFHALTPGRQRSYLFNLNGAKQPKTRFARIEKFRPKIIAGKGANEY